MGNIVDIKKAAAGDEQNPDLPIITFETFWQTWPSCRRIARKQAVEQWKKIHPSHHQKILDAVVRNKKCDQWREANGIFIPYAFRWLRDERWTDDIDTDPTMGLCSWNCNGNRDGELRCSQPATIEKRGVCYCASHGERVR